MATLRARSVLLTAAYFDRPSPSTPPRASGGIAAGIATSSPSTCGPSTDTTRHPNVPETLPSPWGELFDLFA